jgi:pimeloyl-ACP methyl ester carboxylesterase
MHELLEPVGTRRNVAGIDFLQEGATPESASRVFVFLHGIGSGAASWHFQLQAAKSNDNTCVLAWNAPGYESSVALTEQNPKAGHYAKALWLWLEALGIEEKIILVGHSLGALIAASSAVMKPQRISRLVLLAPALGYGDQPTITQDQIVAQRVGNLTKLGAQAMAAARAPAMLSSNASHEQINFVQTVMSKLNPAGYEQAVRMLSTGELLKDLAILTKLPSDTQAPMLQVACGSEDGITPPEKCELAAVQARTALVNLGAVGHLCAFENPIPVNKLLGL